jgi:nucleoside-diphosphate-sugar epimerase
LDHLEPRATGEQNRKFTCVSNTADVLVLAAEEIDADTLANAGRDSRIALNEASELVFDILGWRQNSSSMT